MLVGDIAQYLGKCCRGERSSQRVISSDRHLASVHQDRLPAHIEKRYVPVPLGCLGPLFSVLFVLENNTAKPAPHQQPVLDKLPGCLRIVDVDGRRRYLRPVLSNGLEDCRPGLVDGTALADGGIDDLCIDIITGKRPYRTYPLPLGRDRIGGNPAGVRLTVGRLCRFVAAGPLTVAIGGLVFIAATFIHRFSSLLLGFKIRLKGRPLLVGQLIVGKSPFLEPFLEFIHCYILSFEK